jgi:hypothetical protein
MSRNRAKTVPLIIGNEEVGTIRVGSGGKLEIISQRTPCDAGKELLDAIHNHLVVGVVISLGGDES